MSEQAARARQYALCTIAVGYDRVTDGVEGVFDQALTNGLAAIVAHTWPGKERNGTFMLPAAKLLDVIQDLGDAVETGAVHVPHDPRGPKYKPDLVWDEEPIPNFTTVRVAALRAAIRATQAIRHARDTGQHTTAALTDEHIAALEELDYHPALGTVMDELRNRDETSVAAADAAEQERATAYLNLLEAEELQRREAVDYHARYATGGYKDIDPTTVEDCPVCGNVSLVAAYRENVLGEIGIGQCVVCSYQRTAAVAEDMAVNVQIERAVSRPD